MFKFLVILAFVAAATSEGEKDYSQPIHQRILMSLAVNEKPTTPTVNEIFAIPMYDYVPPTSYGSSDDAHAEIKTLHSDVRADGFNYVVETSNNIRADATGDENGNIHGGFEWISPEGVFVQVTYVADENGYQPSSDLLPTPPPTPVAILKALEYIRTHPQK